MRIETANPVLFDSHVALFQWDRQGCGQARTITNSMGIIMKNPEVSNGFSRSAARNVNCFTTGLAPRTSIQPLTRRVARVYSVP
jgi:hypothetical protein